MYKYKPGGRHIITDISSSNIEAAKTEASMVQTPDIHPIRSSLSMDKMANIRAKASSDITRTAPMFNDPRYTSSTLAIPPDSRTLHGLYRFFGETDPIVGAAIKILAEMPLSDLRLGQCEDSGIQQHFEDMWERMNGFKMLSDLSQEFFELGDCVLFGAWNNADYMWDQFAILNPDYVKIESTWVNQRPLIKLIPDETLRKVVQTKSPRFIYQQLPPEIIRYVLFNQEIPLDPNNVFQISHMKRPYEQRGKSIIKRILKTLMLEDRFNQANFALATRHAVPMMLVKVGMADGSYLPSNEELDEVRSLMANFELDPNFSLIWHAGINIEHVGSNGKMLPVGPELDRIYRLKFIGLGVHEQLLAGQGGSYSAAYVNAEIQRQRYLNYQLKVENFVHSGIFKTTADLCGFYRVKNAVASYSGVKSSKFGNDNNNIMQKLGEQFKTLRDIQDNQEFKQFIKVKADEVKNMEQRQIREYVYPKLDWGSLSASTDENLKNFVKWLVDKRPHLVDDATLARLGRLDRDTQEKAYLEDLRRKQQRLLTISKEVLLPFMQDNKKGGGGPVDFGGIGDISMGGGGDMGGPGGSPEGMGGGEAPIGAGGPPESAGGQTPPAGFSGQLEQLQREVVGDILRDDMTLSFENKDLLNAKKIENTALLRKIDGTE